jgi:hypothetical protein
MLTSQFQATPDLPDCDIWRSPILAFYPNYDNDNNNYQIKCSSRADTNRCTDSNVWTSYRKYLKNIELGKWNDIVIHVNWQYDNTGFLEVWINGDKIAEQMNFPNCSNDEFGPNFKIGIYGNLEENQEVVVYYDEIRIGDSSASYADVVPR